MPINNPPGARTRSFIVPVQHAYNITDSADIHIDSVQSLRLPNAKIVYLTSYFIVPTDYLSGLTVKFLVVPNEAAGNLYVRTVLEFGSCGQSWKAHEVSRGYEAIAIAADMNWNCIQETAVTGAIAGDIVLINTTRDSINALDTLETVIHTAGWLIERTADM